MSSTKRKAVACEHCHKKKVKCQGGELARRPAVHRANVDAELFSGDPCNECGKSGRQCIYPQKDKLVTVTEAYIRQLQAQAMSSSTSFPSASIATPSTAPPAEEATQPMCSFQRPHAPRDKELALENNTAESFVSELKRLGADIGVSAHTPQVFESHTDGSSKKSRPETEYEHVTLSSDSHGKLLCLFTLAG